MKFSKHIAWAHSDTQDVLLLAPYPWKLMSVKSQLQKDGWNVEYVGAVLRGTKTPSKPSPNEGEGKGGVLTQAIETALSDILHYSYPFNPLFIAKSEPFSQLDKPIFAVGGNVGSTIAVDMYEGKGKKAIHSFKPLVRPASTPEHLTITGSGTLFQYVPLNIQNSLNELLSQKFGFVKKQPGFIETIKSAEKGTIYINGNDIAIAISGPAFVDTAHTWLQEEERRYRIERQAFLLPDKTRGYEYVPATAIAVLKPHPTAPGCFTTAAGVITAFVCTRDGYTVFANSLEIINQLPLPPENESYIQIGQAWLQRLGVGNLEEVLIRSSIPTQWTHLDLKLSPR